MEFIDTFEGAVIVSDSDGNIIYLNEKAISNFQKAGRRELIGKNLKDCHQDFSNEKIREIMKKMFIPLRKMVKRSSSIRPHGITTGHLAD
jgi:transcriptional regulator with PAS, ATPase and Fis domain